jgi:hypothetical protein
MHRARPVRPRLDPKYVDYAVVESLDLKELIRAVKDYLDDGWEPLGGVGTMPTGGPFITGGRFFQTLALRA